MIKKIPALLLCCLLLAGCAQSPAAPLPIAQATVPEALYDPGSPMEQQTRGAIRTYPLPMEEVTGLRAMGNDILVFSGETKTTLTLLTGSDLTPRAELRLDFSLDPEDPSLVIGFGGLSLYDPAARETVILNGALEEIRRIAAPQDLAGSPILSRDGKKLYYCTVNALRIWDLDTGLRRLLRSTDGPRLTGLHGNDKVLQCTVGDTSILVSAEDGRLLWEGAEDATLATHAGRYFASLPVGMNRLFLFGGDSPWALTTAEFNGGECFFLENENAAVTAVTDRETVLSYYDLTTGLRSSVLTLNTREPVQAEDTADGRIFLLAQDEDYGQQVLYCWDIDALPVGDPALYTFPHFPSGTSDMEGLADCQAYADEIGSRYGLTILIGEEAAGTQPWDYEFEPELLVPFLRRQLELLDQCLQNFPKQVLEDTMSHFSSLTICLVRSITGTAESGSVEEANGLQFFHGTDVFLALAVGPHSDHPLYHELFHVMETHLLGGSTAFDQWDNINPVDFVYAYDYRETREFDHYLQGERRSFIDRYSMSFPKEDRARIMEYAMTSGNEELFRHKILQAKLEVLCKSIRQACGLKKSPEVFLWEQYLNTPLAYSK